MASPRSEVFARTPGSGRGLSITPGSRILQSPVSDEAIWKRLKEAGFDEESIKRRDKAALIAYIAKLEAEVTVFLPCNFEFYLLFFFLLLGLIYCFEVGNLINFLKNNAIRI